MKVVQTFWSGPNGTNRPMDIHGGWASPEYNLMSWVLSALLLRRHYDQLELYTDELGKRILIDILGLPYTKVHIVFDHNFKIHPGLFALAKIKTYSLQDEPFVHVDGDLFLWNPLPENIANAGLIASNVELDLYFNKNVLEEMEEHFQYIPGHLKNVSRQDHIFSSNAGIFGGSNIAFIKKYCAMAHQLVAKNQNHLGKVNNSHLNMLVEQISLYYLADLENIEIEYCVAEPVDHPLYKDYWRFADIPNVPMIHPVGGCKRIPYVLHHLAHRLLLEFPLMYYKIIRYCTGEGISLRNRLYNFLDFDAILDGEDLHKADFFKNSINLPQLERPTSDWRRFYHRTLLVAKHYYPNRTFTKNRLESIVQKEDTKAALKEIYFLETQNFNCYDQLILEIKKGEIYGQEVDHYAKTTNFNMTADWLHKKVALKKGVRPLKVKNAWGLLNVQEPKKSLSKILESPKKEHCVTLSRNLLTLDIHETYHEGLDAILIPLLETPMRIEDILIRLAAHFEEEIDIHNPQYQLLAFDVLKRLSFENMVSVYE